MKTLQYYSIADQQCAGLDAPILTEDQAFRDYMDENRRQRKAERELAKATAKKQKVKRSQPQRRAKTTPEIKWLKSLICPFVYGEKTPDGVRPSITKESFVDRWNLKLGLPSLANYKLSDHFQSIETIYFFGNGWEKCRRSLVMIDIDVLKAHGRGSPEGARRFAEHLKRIWPDLYFETSTNGNGIHGYFILYKSEIGAEKTNAALKRFEKWLRVEAQRINADIEQVEIKGTCLDLRLEGRMVQSVQYGSFAKLPRDVSRFEEWQNTTVMRVRDLESNLFDEGAVPTYFPVDETTLPTVVKFPVPTVVSKTILKLPLPSPVASSQSKSFQSNSVSGSVSGKVINDDELAGIPVFERMYREWVGPKDLMAGKFRVTAHDFAVAMVILNHFKVDPNSDGSLPTRRVGEMWTGLFTAGDVQRGWNHHRWKVIRDFLSARGHIDWKEHRYEYETVVLDKDGNKDVQKSKRGIACKWAISEEFHDHLTIIVACNVGGVSFVDTKKQFLVPQHGKGENWKPQPFPLRAEMEQEFWHRAYEACESLCAA